MKECAKNSFVLLTTAFIFFFTIEIFLIIFPSLLPQDIQLLMERGPIHDRILLETGYVLDDPILGFKLKPNLTFFKRHIPDSDKEYLINTISLGFDNIGFRDDGINEERERDISWRLVYFWIWRRIK